MAGAAAFLITGIPGAGKTTVSRLLARRFDRAAHIEADRLQEMIVSGGRWPDEEPHDEAMRQLDLRACHAAILTASFVRAGFAAVVDDVIIGPRRLAFYTRAVGRLYLIVLAPALQVARSRDEHRKYKRVGDRWPHLDAEQREGLAGLGLWLDTSDLEPGETVEAILAPDALRRALIRRARR
jgi:predicted kinase